MEMQTWESEKKKVGGKDSWQKTFWISVSSNEKVSNMFQIFAQEKSSTEPPFIKDIKA